MKKISRKPPEPNGKTTSESKKGSFLDEAVHMQTYIPFLRKHRRILHPAEAFIIVGCLLVTMLMAQIVDAGVMGTLPYAGASLDMFGMFLCFIFYISIYMDDHYVLGQEKFLVMFSLSTLMMFLDIVSWYVNGNVDFMTINLISRYGKNGLLFIFTLGLWMFIKKITNMNRRKLNFYNSIISVFFVIAAFLLLSNAVFGYVFVIDGNGYFIQGTMQIYFYASLLAVCVLGLISFITEDTKKRDKLCCILCVLVCISFTMLQYSGVELSLTYMAPVTVLIVAYANIYLTRCEELAQRNANLKIKRYELMVSQVQPHFLYNALSSIMVMKGNPQETVEALMEYSSVLRHNLNNLKVDGLVTFESEIDAIQSYLYIEKLRFKDELNVEWDLEDTMFNIPPNTIQPLVQNAVFYGISAKEGGGTLTIRTSIGDNGHVIQIIDDGVGFDVESVKNNKQGHRSISNIARRLREFVNGSIDIKSEVGKGTVVIILIPFNHAPATVTDEY